MGRTYKLAHFTKGTGAAVEPIDEAPAAPTGHRATTRRKANVVRFRSQPRKPSARPHRASTPLPPGHVRKAATGEIGRVQSVDPRAGTATVLWLKQGRTSTVPLTALRRS